LTFGTGTTSTTERMRIDSSGRVGIGTTSPNNSLQINGGAADTAFQITNSATGSTATDGFSITVENPTPDVVIRNREASNMRFLTSNTERVRIDSSGQVGIGTSSPASGVSASQCGLNIAHSNAAYISLDNTNTNGHKYTIFSDDNGKLHTYDVDASSFRMVLDSSGNVGIGTSSPAKTFHVSDATGTNLFRLSGANGFTFDIESTGTGNQFDFDIGSSGGIYTFNNSNGELMRIDSSGNLLVSTTSFSQQVGEGSKLVSNGRLFQVSSYDANTQESLSMYSTGASAFRFYVGWGGTVYATNTSISAISDERLKENIRDLDVGLDAVMALKPRKFDWKEGKGQDKKDVRGFIAQEFEQVFPDLVDEWKDPAPEGEEPYKSVRQDLIPVLVKAIQEQQATIQELEARITALETA